MSLSDCWRRRWRSGGDRRRRATEGEFPVRCPASFDHREPGCLGVRVVTRCAAGCPRPDRGDDRGPPSGSHRTGVSKALDAHTHTHPELDGVGGSVDNGSRERLIDWANFLINVRSVYGEPLRRRPGNSTPDTGQRVVQGSSRSLDVGQLEVGIPSGTRSSPCAWCRPSSAYACAVARVPGALPPHFHNGGGQRRGWRRQRVGRDCGGALRRWSGASVRGVEASHTVFRGGPF